ncbi:MAG: phosphomethylpyrimidine kinase [Candidatus Lokiarchaeota archaeon]|nr:phosphomethylpyrimidine kinase [Candidatus Lokiarchaeota archaeon]
MSEEEREKVIGRLVLALKKLKEFESFSEFMPEVRINLAYAINNPKKIDDVAAIPGRITEINNKAFIPTLPEFGASDHMARNLIEFAKYDKKIRSGINIKYTEDIVEWLVEYCEKNDLLLSIVDRSKEPEKVKRIDGASIPWKIIEAVRQTSNMIPNIIIEGPALGKEPLIILTGTDPIEVINLFKELYENWIKIKKEQNKEI